MLPKGNRIRGLTPPEAAAQEAWEEAGLTGAVAPEPLGAYRYLKRRRLRDRWLTVQVFALAVSAQADDWPERDQRRLRWFAPADAAAAVAEPELGRLIAGFTRPETSR